MFVSCRVVSCVWLVAVLWIWVASPTSGPDRFRPGQARPRSAKTAAPTMTPGFSTCRWRGWRTSPRDWCNPHADPPREDRAQPRVAAGERRRRRGLQQREQHSRKQQQQQRRCLNRPCRHLVVSWAAAESAAAPRLSSSNNMGSRAAALLRRCRSTCQSDSLVNSASAWIFSLLVSSC